MAHSVFLSVAFALFLSANPAFPIEVTLSASGDYVPVGTAIRVEAATNEVSEPWYRFRIRSPEGRVEVIRDFGPQSSLDWSAAGHEGTYQVELTARDNQTGEETTNLMNIDLTSRVLDGRAAITATSHPLVFLYSAPPCPSGNSMMVEFEAPGGAVRRTPPKPCDSIHSMNYFLAGLYANTPYTARHVIAAKDCSTSSDPVEFTTGEPAGTLYPASILQPAPAGATNEILLINGSGAPTATDLNGAILWYTTGIQFITRVEKDGHFWTLSEGPTNPALSFIRKFDLLGNVVLETNAARVNEQLRALGKREITGFHHEALTLPDGRVAALAGVEQILTDIQGPGPVDVLGDMIVVLDAELNVVWTWDAFDHLDVRRTALLGETCGRTTAGCAPFHLSDTVNDWTHGNSIQPTPDGNLLFSTRHQDWLVKVDYQNGAGDGHAIWRLGPEGDFSVISNDAYPWFTHQHDGRFDPSDPTALMVFDNGNTRFAKQGGNSRGQVFKLDEEQRTATLVLNADLGVFAPAVGSVQRLVNGNYHFDAGYVPETSGLRAYSIEVAPNGQIVFNATIENLSYRSFRLIDMYTPD